MCEKVVFDWKCIVALGAAVSMVIFAVKMDPEAAKEVSTHVADACKEYALIRHDELML